MRRLGLRFRLRWIMVVVALVALFLAAIHLEQLIGRDADEKAADGEWANHPHGGPI